MPLHQCPEHIGTGLTPTDEECHSHKSDTQQRFHNLHCRLLKCPHALNGTERYDDVPLLSPRNLFEKFLSQLDSFES